MGTDTRSIYRFDRFKLDLIRGALLGPDGAELPLRPKSFTLLRYMVGNAGRLVDKDELMAAVWPGVFVTDDSIAQCVKDIRRALGDDKQRVLRTSPRRGYLFAAEVVGDAPPPTVQPMPVQPGPPAVLPVPVANRPIMVVQPFENIGGEHDQAYLANGVTADLVTDLTRFEDLHVVSPPSYARHSLMSGTTAEGWSVPQDARYLVTGNVRRAEGRVRVTIRLEDARTGISLWAERFDRPIGGLMALQEELAEQLPAHLAGQIQRDATKRARGRPTVSLDAYDLCLRGREHQLRVTEPDTIISRQLFDRAIQLDPDYATAYAWQAYTVQRGFTWSWGEPRGQEAAKLALTLARQGVDLDPESSLCLGRLSLVLLLNHKWDEALASGRAGVHANHCLPASRYDYGDVLAHAGDPREAERELRLAHALDPFHAPHWRVPLARSLIRMERWDEALVELHGCRALLPHYIPCLQSLAAVGIATGRLDEAREAVSAMLRREPRLTVREAESLMFFRDPDMLELHLRGLRAGGMPRG